MKRLNKTIGAMALCFCLLQSVNAKAMGGFETIDLGIGNIYLNPGVIQTVRLPHGDWRRVEKIYVRAIGMYGDAMFEVMVNGDTKGSIHVPGRDPSYIVTIAETTSSLQLRHVSGGTVRIDNIKVVQAVDTVPCVSNGCQPNFTELPRPFMNEASFLAREAIRLTDALEGFASYKEYGIYLLPIKKAAARAYAAAQAKGGLSLSVREYLICLKQQIEFAAPYLDVSFEKDYAFELSVQLRSLGERLAHVLH